MPVMPPPPGKPPVSSTDLTISIITLVLTVMLGAVAAVLGVFSLAFLDDCPRESCSANGAATAVMTSLCIAGLVGVVGLVVTIIRLVGRRTAWPFALGTLLICGAVLFFGGIGFVSAVGGMR